MSPLLQLRGTIIIVSRLNLVVEVNCEIVSNGRLGGSHNTKSQVDVLSLAESKPGNGFLSI